MPYIELRYVAIYSYILHLAPHLAMYVVMYYKYDFQSDKAYILQIQYN